MEKSHEGREAREGTERALDELPYKYNEGTLSSSRIPEEKDLLHNQFERRTMPQMARNNVERILDVPKKLNDELESKNKKLDTWSKELNKCQALTERERQKLYEDKNKHKHGTTNVVIVVRGGVILAVDSRATSLLLGLESHEWVNKARRFTHSNLFMTLCGDRWTATALYDFLNRFHGLTPLTAARRAQSYISAARRSNLIRSIIVESLFVGFVGGLPEVYVATHNRVARVTTFEVVGSGTGHAYNILAPGYRMDLSMEQGAELAYRAVINASLGDRCKGDVLTVHRISNGGDVDTSVDSVLDAYLTRFVELRVPHHSALYALVPEDMHPTSRDMGVSFG